MNTTLKHFIAEYTPLVRHELEQFFANKKTAAQSVSPHLAQSIDLLNEFVARGGKLLRPLLVIAGYRLAGGTSQAIYQVAAGVELYHRQLLCIDDMADRDEQRYGGLTLWKKYEELFADWQNVEHHARSLSEIDATLFGSYANELVMSANISAEAKVEISRLVNELVYTATTVGWQIQYHMNHIALPEATEAEFLKGLEFVTSHYTFEAPLLIGVTVAEYEKTKQFNELKSTLSQYSLHVGRAFQLYDDILGLFGETKKTGKPVGNDLREGKKTLLLQRAYRQADQKQKETLVEFCGQTLTAPDLSQVQEIIKTTGALESVKTFMEEEVRKGKQVLEQLDPAQLEIKQILSDLAEFTIHREA